MPIAAQCGSCAARYKIVDSATGRRVRCRRCGKPFTVPGAVPVERGPDLRALADLERKGQVVAASAESEFERYQATIATLNQTSQSEKDAAAAKRKSLGRSVTEVATPDYFKRNAIDVAAAKRNANARGAMFESMQNLLSIIGCVALVACCALGFVDNLAVAMLALAAFWMIMFGAYVWVVVLAFIEHWGHGLAVMFVPFYWVYYRYTRSDELSAPVNVLICGFLLRIVLLFAYTKVALHQGAVAMTTPTSYVAAPTTPPGHLNEFGEIEGTGTTRPSMFLNGVAVYERPQAKIQRILYYINIGTGVDSSLHPPIGFKQELDQLLRNQIKANGLIEFDKAHLACYLHVIDLGARPQMFTESNGTYVPDDSGKVSANVPYLRCSFALDGDEGRLLHEEKRDFREIKEPIKASSTEELQKAIDAYQWKAAMDYFKALHLPDKPMWTQYDQGHWEQKVLPKTQPSQTQESSSPAPDAKATAQ